MTVGPSLQLKQELSQGNVPDLHTLRTWLTLQSVETVSEVVAACVEELRQRRLMATPSIPESQDFGGIEEG